MTGIARQYHTQQVHYLRKTVLFSAVTAVPILVGTIPAGSLILKPISGAYVNVAFNHGTNNLLNIGISGDTDLWGTVMSLATIAAVPLDEAVTQLVAADTDIYATPDFTGTAGTTGSAEVIIAYIPDNDG